VTTKRRGMTEEAADAAIDQACRMLRMPTIRNSFTDYADRAGREQMSYRGFLAELLLAECDDRARRRSERRIKAAKFPREKSLRAFDFDANPNIDSAVIHTLAKCEWVQKGQPLCLIGDSGTGKSHLLIALGTEAAMAGYRVKYTLATQLANELVEAADEMTLAKTIARYGRVDLLCIDELGYMQLDRRGAELLFQVLTEREEKASVAIASNESFGGWTKTFTGHREPLDPIHGPTPVTDTLERMHPALELMHLHEQRALLDRTRAGAPPDVLTALTERETRLHDTLTTNTTSPQRNQGGEDPGHPPNQRSDP
jgi:DNA replication protein DnaC